MKIDWDNAPEWANYVAMDSDGYWHWYELQPQADYHYDEWTGDGKVNCFDSPRVWDTTLEGRPNE